MKWDKGAYFLIGESWFCLNVDLNRKPNTCGRYAGNKKVMDDIVISCSNIRYDCSLKGFKMQLSKAPMLAVPAQEELSSVGVRLDARDGIS